MRMNSIILEGSVFSKQVANGISNYASKLLGYWLQNKSTDFTYEVLVTKGYKKNIFLRDLHLPPEAYACSSSLRFATQMSTGLQVHKTRIFHSPYMFLPPKNNSKVNLLTVHDMINFERNQGIRNLIRKNLLHLAISRSDNFICISQTTKTKLLDFFPAIDPQTIHVIYQGVDDLFFSDQLGIKRPARNKPYVLYVGLRGEYKNFESLLTFFKTSNWKKDLDILCVGGGAFTPEEKSLFNSLGLAPHIHHAGFVETQSLRSLYGAAFALAYTSLAEGFGLPIIEGMASGCPVICGNFSAMKEVAGGKAILVDDFSPASFEAAFVEASQFSARQKDEAKLYASAFTWDKTARKTFELYHQLAQ